VSHVWEALKVKAKPNTIVGDLAICSNCGKGLRWIEQYQIWVHMESNTRHCGGDWGNGNGD
jgi:hypothetical protein